MGQGVNIGAPRTTDAASGFGLYVHVPFCRRHCPYCDFAVVVARNPPREAYRDAVLAELGERAAENRRQRLRTIYFGGGTPSLWGATNVGAVLDAAAARWPGPLDEVTLEVNPEDATPRLLRDLRAAGVDRLSFGVQSFDDRTARALGRAHDGRSARRAVLDAHKAGFDQVSVDLVLCVPGEPEDRNDRELVVLEELPVDHVSAYELTYEPRTAFSARVARGALEPLDEELVVARTGAVRAGLAAAGFERYEVSSFARPGRRALHNAAYWSGRPYLGLGVGAHSLVYAGDGIVRSANGRNLRHYLAGDRASSDERLAPSAHVAELVMLGVRTSDGVDFGVLARRFGPAVVTPFRALARGWESRGLGHLDAAGRYRPTPEALDVADVPGAEAIALAEPEAI